MSFYTGTQSEVLFSNGAAFPAANAASAAAQSLVVGASAKFQQPVFPGLFFQTGRTGQVVAADFAVILTGQASATTALFSAGLNTSSQGASGTVTGTTLASTGTFTCTSFSSATVRGRVLISCFGSGYGTSSVSTNLWTTIDVSYQNTSPASAGVVLGGPTNVTNVDSSVNQWFWLAVTFSTSSATNSATLQQLAVYGLN